MSGDKVEKRTSNIEASIDRQDFYWNGMIAALT